MKKIVKYLYITRYTFEKISVVNFYIFIFDLYYTYYISAMEAHIIANLKFTYYIICAMEVHIIVNHKFTNYIKFNVGKAG